MLELQLCLPPLRQVASDLGEADDLSALFDGVNDDAGPEARAVLTQPPAFRGEAAFTSRRLERFRRELSVYIFWSVELGKVPPNNFIPVVALDSLRAGIPA
jgi:hypothetical protein